MHIAIDTVEMNCQPFNLYPLFGLHDHSASINEYEQLQFFLHKEI